MMNNLLIVVYDSTELNIVFRQLDPFDKAKNPTTWQVEFAFPNPHPTRQNPDYSLSRFLAQLKRVALVNPGRGGGQGEPSSLSMDSSPSMDASPTTSGGAQGHSQGRPLFYEKGTRIFLIHRTVREAGAGDQDQVKYILKGIPGDDKFRKIIETGRKFSNPSMRAYWCYTMYHGKRDTTEFVKLESQAQGQPMTQVFEPVWPGCRLMPFTELDYEWTLDGGSDQRKVDEMLAAIQASVHQRQQQQQQPQPQQNLPQNALQ